MKDNPTYSEKKFFLITSHGRTATYWLASCLNLHPDIACTHGPVLPPVFEFPDPPSDALTKYAHENLDSFYSKSVDGFFDELEKSVEAKLYGNVHAYTADQLYSLMNINETRRNPRIMNLVRHPVLRIESLKRRMIYESAFSDSVRNMLRAGFDSYVTQDVVQNITSETEVDFDNPETRAFIYSACFVMTHDLRDFQWPVVHVPMERLTRDIDYFIWFLGSIGQDHVPVTMDFANKVFQQKRKNGLADEMSSLDRYESWEEWKKTVFGIVVEKFDGVTMYDPMGYDLSFVSRKSEFQRIVPLIYPIMPELIETDLKGFNILLYRNTYYGLSHSAGTVDLTALTGPEFNRFVLNGWCVVGSDVRDVLGKIMAVVNKTDKRTSA